MANDNFGSMYSPNSAMGRADKATKARARKNRNRYMENYRAVQEWARRGFVSGAEDYENEEHGKETP